MTNDFQQRMAGDLGEEAQEEALREVIRVAVEMVFSSVRVMGARDVTVAGGVVNYRREDLP